MTLPLDARRSRDWCQRAERQDRIAIGREARVLFRKWVASNDIPLHAPYVLVLPAKGET